MSESLKRPRILQLVAAKRSELTPPSAPGEDRELSLSPRGISVPSVLSVVFCLVSPQIRHRTGVILSHCPILTPHSCRLSRNRGQDLGGGRLAPQAPRLAFRFQQSQRPEAGREPGPQAIVPTLVRGTQAGPLGRLAVL